MKKDRMSLVEGIMYLIRDVLYYSELVEIKQFLESIMKDKKQGGYVDQFYTFNYIRFYNLPTYVMGGKT